MISGTFADESLLRKALGIAAVELAGEVIERNELVGLSSGRTIYEMVNSLGNMEKNLEIKVVPWSVAGDEWKRSIRLMSCAVNLPSILAVYPAYWTHRWLLKHKRPTTCFWKKTCLKKSG